MVRSCVIQDVRSYDAHFTSNNGDHHQLSLRLEGSISLDWKVHTHSKLQHLLTLVQTISRFSQILGIIPSLPPRPFFFLINTWESPRNQGCSLHCDTNRKVPHSQGNHHVLSGSTTGLEIETRLLLLNCTEREWSSHEKMCKPKLRN